MFPDNDVTGEAPVWSVYILPDGGVNNAQETMFFCLDGFVDCKCFWCWSRCPLATLGGSMRYLWIAFVESPGQVRKNDFEIASIHVRLVGLNAAKCRKWIRSFL